MTKPKVPFSNDIAGELLKVELRLDSLQRTIGKLQTKKLRLLRQQQCRCLACKAEFPLYEWAFVQVEFLTDDGGDRPWHWQKASYGKCSVICPGCKSPMLVSDGGAQLLYTMERIRMLIGINWAGIFASVQTKKS